MSLSLRAWGGTLNAASPSWDGVSFVRVEPDGTAVLQWKGDELHAATGKWVPGIIGLSVVATDYAAQSVRLHFKGCETPSEQ
jgi:hypothetical protein